MWIIEVNALDGQIVETKEFESEYDAEQFGIDAYNRYCMCFINMFEESENTPKY